MANPPLIGANGSSIVGAVMDPGVTAYPDGSAAVAAMGKAGDQLMNSSRGQHGVMSSRQHVFFQSITTAAQAIPVNTTTNANTFALVNPADSTVEMELIDFKLDFLHTNAAPATATCIGLSFARIADNAISAITKAPVPMLGAVGSIPGRVGSAGAVSRGYVATALTFASALTVALNWGYPLWSFPASWVPTVGGYPVPLVHEFKGKLVIPPGIVATLTASTAWGANTTIPSVSWVEHKV